MRNKKGLSTIVVTLIIILLSLVAVGVVWVVVRNLITTGSEGIDISSKCLKINLEASKVNCSSVGVSRICDVRLTRSGTGTDALGGVKLVFKNSTSGTNSPLIDVAGDVPPLIPRTQTGINTTLPGVNEVDVTAYFLDQSNNQKFCDQQTMPFTTTSAF